MQSVISFLRTREPPGPQGCLMEKSLNLLHPLAYYRGYSRSTVSLLERFVVLIIWPHKAEWKSQWCQKSSGYLHKREETLRTCPWQYLNCIMNGATVTRRLHNLKLCLTCILCSLNRSPPPPYSPAPLPWRWGMSSEEKLITKWFEIMPKFQKGHCIFPHKRNLYKYAYRDTPIPPPKLFPNLPPTPLRKLC